jgi:molecular chaperone GrpE
MKKEDTINEEQKNTVNNESENPDEVTQNEQADNEKQNNHQENNHQENDTTETIEKTPDYKTLYETLNDKYLRLYSEYDNYRKRTAREKSELIKTAGVDVIKSILPVLDDFERAIKANENINDPQTLKEGFTLIHSKLNNIMQAKGLKAMNLLDTEFNADISEAIANLPSEDETKKGKVLDVVENGYYLNDVLIRYAKVVVGA